MYMSNTNKKFKNSKNLKLNKISQAKYVLDNNEIASIQKFKIHRL